jgi:hypothetical protein
MPGRRRQPDWDPYEFGARRSDPELAALEPIAGSPPRVRTSTVLLVAVAAVAFVLFSRGTFGRDHPGPAVTGSCTSPAVSLSKDTTRTYGALEWSATGPSGSSVVIGLDTTSLPGAADRLSAPVPLTGCRAHGRVGVHGAVGPHRLTFFAVAPDGSATVLATKAVHITRG